MSNYNLTIALTKLKGAKVMEIQGKTCTKTCVVIPIDNEEGTVRDSYEGKIDGMPQLSLLMMSSYISQPSNSAPKSIGQTLASRLLSQSRGWKAA